MVMFLRRSLYKGDCDIAPIIGAAIVYVDGNRAAVRSRRWKEAGFFLLPVLAWILLRHLAFSSTVSGVYVFSDFSLAKQLFFMLHGILSWPMGLRSPNEAPIFKYAFFAINSSFWLLIILGIVGAFRVQCGQTASDSRCVVQVADQFGIRSRERLIVLAFCIGSLGMPILLDLRQRFGASFYPLFFLMLACIFQSAPLKSFRTGALAICIVLVTVTFCQRINSDFNLHSLQTQWAMSADYAKTISQTKAKTLFTLDDVSGGFSSPESIQRFTHYSGVIVRLNDIVSPFSKCSSGPEVSIRDIGSASVSIDSGPLSTCGVYAFDNAASRFTAFPMRRAVRDTHTGRLAITLESPSGAILIQIDDVPANSEVLIPEIDRRKYREIELNAQPRTHLVTPRAG